MLGLDNKRAVLPKKKGRRALIQDNTVRIAIHKYNGKMNVVCITFYGETFAQKMARHGLVPYILNNALAFKLDDEDGFQFSLSQNNDDIGTIKTKNERLLLACISNVGTYPLHYDKDDDAYYIKFAERIEVGR